MSAALVSSRPVRVLVVDDLDLNRDLLIRRVQRLGHEGVAAVDGRDALAKLAQDEWDLVLLDITMPQMDGYETLGHIRADPRLAQLPVVMVSAIDEAESVVRCLELGADDYLTKPFNPRVLQARVEASLVKKRLQDQQAQLLAALSREMEIGHRIQQGFLPAQLPSVPGWSLAAFCRPARHVGGDFYDAFVLPDGQCMLVVADVCDKGVGAALYMALFRTLLRVTAQQLAPGAAPHDVLQRCVGATNDYIASVHGQENMFATAFVALLEPQGGTLTYLNAGHELPLLRRGGQGAPGVVALEVSGPALGLVAGPAWHIHQVSMGPNDMLVAFSDGLTEALEASGDLAVDRLDALMADGHREANTLALGISRALEGGPEVASDDITLLALVRT
ncbi:SpoIIE family protein phosphatase [Variovorax dokdonensis]|uniref:SpoIIE family protein phosphatase n=1 Tax=Variovorax dokdonensis TaxID=344883 RepID=A0ABT7N825_9BURK|nr:SpoIIE family protein phosphatase [Variovorax dokdonensis]MDM0044076.1 SpoIIE family protein phosphatase [Variovorax dokdonensis]